MLSSEDDTDGGLGVKESLLESKKPHTNAGDILLQKAREQEASTRGLFRKVWQFCRILFGQENELEKVILMAESNDCSFVSKYSKVVDIDLTKVRSISVERVSVASIHVPHPLINFMKNEKNRPPIGINIEQELLETPIVLFIHGMGGQMSQFEPLMGLLSQCLELLSLDLPGFGNSRRKFQKDRKIISSFSEEEKQRISSSISAMQQEDFTSDNITNLLISFIEQNVPLDKRLLLVGHSMGTHLSTKIALRLPKHRVEGLVLLSPPSFYDDVTISDQIPLSRSSHSLRIFTWFPFLFQYFRVWDRLEGLNSQSVLRQFARLYCPRKEKSYNPNENEYNRIRQLRWNLDIDSHVVLNYASGFKKALYAELVTAILNFNNNPGDENVYQKTLLISGTGDAVTPSKTIFSVEKFLHSVFGRKVSSAIEVSNAGHSLLLVKPEFVSGIILNHLEQNFPERLHLAPAWVLKLKADIAGDKWGLKNELKWLKLKPVSDNITRKHGKEVAPLLGMKTLREGDSDHSPSILEDRFYNQNAAANNNIKGKLIAIVDISADIPPYSPKSFHHIKYYKCATVSKVVPDGLAVRRFIHLIDDILSSNTIECPLIAVHCHYGFNRTGFLICCYLIERLHWSVSEAIEGFKRARPPGIKHQHFIDALYVRYEL